MRKILFIGSLLITISACSTVKPMPDSRYSSIGLHSAGLTSCFNAGLVSPEFFAKGKRSLNTVLGAWQYDPEKLEVTTKKHQKSFKPTTVNCRKVQAEFIGAEMGISDAKAELERSRRAIQRNKPVYCNQYGTMTVCN